MGEIVTIMLIASIGVVTIYTMLMLVVITEQIKNKDNTKDNGRK